MKKIIIILLLFVILENNFAIASASNENNTQIKQNSTSVENNISKNNNDFTETKLKAKECRDFSFAITNPHINTSLGSSAYLREYRIRNLKDNDILLTNITFNKNEVTIEEIRQETYKKALKRAKPCIPTTANLGPGEQSGYGLLYALSFGGFIAPFMGLKDFVTGNFGEGFQWLGGAIMVMPASAIGAPIIIVWEGTNIIFYPIKYINYNLLDKYRFKKDVDKYSHLPDFPITIHPQQEYKFILIMPSNYFVDNVFIHIQDEKELKNYIIYDIY